MKIQKCLAMLLAVIWMLCAMPALAMPDATDELLVAPAGEQEGAPEANTPEASQAPEEPEDDELYVPSPDEEDPFEEEIIVDELITVEDFAITDNLPDEWWNILLLGTDNRYQSNTYGRTDSMIILSINLATREAKLTSLMRDTWVPMHGRKSKAKLNSACVYGGPELTMRTVNECFGMNISNYALINITGLADVIDLLGGIDIDVTEKERKALNKGLFDLSEMSGMEKLEESGENVHLNGNQAVAFSRIRQIDTDYKRTERQRYVLTAIADKLKQNDAATLVSVVNKLLGYVETNLSITELMTLAYVGLQLDMEGLEQFRVPVDGTFDAGMFDGVWCIKPNFEKNKTKLYDFIYGE